MRLRTPVADVGKPLRFAIQDVYRFDERRIVGGRVESGTVRVGDRLLFVPSGTQATVKTIERWQAPAQESAVAGDSIGLTFTEQLFLRRGDVASTLQDTPCRSWEFEARLFWLGAAPLATKHWYAGRSAPRTLLPASRTSRPPAWLTTLVLQVRARLSGDIAPSSHCCASPKT